MSDAKSVNNTKYYIHSAIVLLLTFGFGYLPTIGSITPVGMQVFGVFLGMLYGWIFVGLLWPSILGIIALGLTDYTTVTASFSAAIGHQNTIIVFVALLFGCYLDQSGLSKTIAYKLVTIKACNGHPWLFITLFFLAVYAVGAVVNLFACIVLMSAFYYQIAEMIKEERYSSLSAFILIGICFIAVLGSFALPVKEMGIFVRALMEPTLGFQIPFIPWMVWFNVMHLLAVAVYLFIGRFIIRVDTTKLQSAGDFLSEYRTKGIPREQILPLVMLLIFVFALIIPSFMPACAVKTLLSNMGLVGVGSALIVFLLIARDSNGTPLADFKEMVTKSINWDLILLIAATMPVGAAMEDGSTGIIAWLTSLLMPLSQAVSPVMLVIIITVFFCAVSQIAHNMVLMIVMIPMLESLAMSIGANPLVLALMFNYGVALAILTPGASAQAAIFHGNTEWITTKQAYGYSGITVLLQLIVGLIVGIPLASFLFPM